MVSVKRRLVAGLLVALLALGIPVGIAGAASNQDGLFDLIRTVFSVVQSHHKDGADLETFVRGAIRGGLEELGDPYTNYFDDNEFSQFLESLDGNVTGIGVYLEISGNYVIVASPIKGSPAAAAGLKTGDRILEADGHPLVGAPIETAQRLIRGEPGTQVRLKLERPSEQRTFEVTITRALIHIPQVESEMLEQGVGYVQLASFGDEAAKEFFAAIADLKQKGATSLILDLRQNPGGYVDAAVSIASGWVPAGEPVVIEVGKGGRKVHSSSGKLINLPTAVLVDGGSASASEILAGAIQDYGAGTLIGTQTFGKGTVQQLLFMSGGGGMKVTISEYLTAKERTVQDVGLTPDLVVEPYTPDPELRVPMVFTRLLTGNRVGLDVLGLQKRLAFLGYQPDTDGFFSGATSQAVVRFAREHQLSQEPIVDQAFVNALNKAVVERLKQAPQQDPQRDAAVRLLTGGPKE